MRGAGCAHGCFLCCVSVDLMLHKLKVMALQIRRCGSH
jgi:hypothetical protein